MVEVATGMRTLLTKMVDVFIIHKYFFQTKLSAANKVEQLFRSYLAVLTRQDRFTYLDKVMFTSSRFDPIVMLTYPAEISFLKSFIKENEIKNVVDVGANIGQFARTMKFFFPNARIFSFEPFSKTFKILKNNTDGISDWSVFNYAIGNPTDDSLYLSKHGSAEHSLVRSEAGSKKVKIKTKALDKTLVPSKIDLLKIDVEGYELEVIKNTKYLEIKYLLIEVDKKNTEEDLERIRKAVQKFWKRRCSLVCLQFLNQNAVKADALLTLS